jgi:hypothetical protein
MILNFTAFAVFRVASPGTLTHSNLLELYHSWQNVTNLIIVGKIFCTKLTALKI